MATTVNYEKNMSKEISPRSRDEVDFVNNNNINNFNNIDTNRNGSRNVPISQLLVYKPKNNLQLSNKTTTTTTTTSAIIDTNGKIQNGNCKMKSAETSIAENKKPLSKLDKWSIFAFSKKLNQKSNSQMKSSTVIKAAAATATTTTTATPTKKKSIETIIATSTPSSSSWTTTTTTTSTSSIPTTDAIAAGRQLKYVRSTSLTRLFGSTTYNTKKYEKEEMRRRNGSGDSKFNTFSGARRRSNGPYLERFKKYSKEDGDYVDNNTLSSATLTKTTTTTATTTKAKTNEIYSIGGSQLELSNLDPKIKDDLSSKAFRTISRSLGKFWWRKSHSVDISPPDPEYKVSYLGNVLTGWAKGEGCVEKQLNTLWRNYTQNNKPDVIMRIKVCASGLKATTRQHGLTEYWANRITHCCAPKNYPRIFCWIYRHEGRKLKHELRCHAVLCSKEKIVQDICSTLKDNLERALLEFKRDKILKQNARLSLANAAYDNPSLPRRKILLSVGGNNYRPPLERSKSAPKLTAIEEAIGEEGEDCEETNEPEMKACCQKDSLYPAMTLGRRRCRRGHSIRRTGKTRPAFLDAFNADPATTNCKNEKSENCCGNSLTTKEPLKAYSNGKVKTVVKQELHNHNLHHHISAVAGENNCTNCTGSDEDDFEKLLLFNNYDTNSTLSGELLPYFDMKLHKNISSSLGSLTDLQEVEIPLNAADEDLETEGESISLIETINTDPNADPCSDFSLDVSEDIIDRNDIVSDDDFEEEEEEELEDEREAEESEVNDLYFRQANILNMLHRNSMRKMANFQLSSSEEGSSIETTSSSNHRIAAREEAAFPTSSSSSPPSSSPSSPCDETGGISSSSSSSRNCDDSTNLNSNRKQFSLDSDEGSISSGCETASIITTNIDDVSLKYRGGSAHSQLEFQIQGHQKSGASTSATKLETTVNDVNMNNKNNNKNSINDGHLYCSEVVVAVVNDGSNGIHIAGNGCSANDDDDDDDEEEEIYQRHQMMRNSDDGRHGSDATIFSSSSSITLKLGGSSRSSSTSSSLLLFDNNNCRLTKQRQREQQQQLQQQQKESFDNHNDLDFDSDRSDESGYVEYQETKKKSSTGNNHSQHQQQQPQRQINITSTAV